MKAIAIILVAAIVFGVCRAVDLAFTKAFRSKAQHMSGLAIRASKRYGVFGVVMSVLGILGICSGIAGDKVLLFAGIFVLLLGICLTVYYLSYGIFYDGESMLVSKFGKKSRSYLFREIEQQHLYVVTGGNIVIELNMADGSAVSIQSNMDGVYRFLDTAFAGWCMQKNIDPQSCSFHDPSKSWWFPHEEEAG